MYSHVPSRVYDTKTRESKEIINIEIEMKNDNRKFIRRETDSAKKGSEADDQQGLVNCTEIKFKKAARPTTAKGFNSEMRKKMPPIV